MSEMPETPQPHALEKAAQPKFKRVVKSRSKKGCSTCKNRRLKCDETFPECNRCVELYGTCSGYPSQATQTRKPRPTFQTLVPAVISKDLSLNLNIFNNEVEQRYFQVFAQDIAPRTNLAGEFNSRGILTHLVPQACYHEPALRRAYIALGAFYIGQAQELPNDLVRDNYSTRQIYEYALQQYQKAIIAMREVKDIRTALIACLLVFSIEVSVKNLDLAFRQILSGLKLLEHHDPSDGSVLNDGIEDDLVSAFRTLEIHTLNSTGILTTKLHHDISTRGPILMEFSTIDEARQAQEQNSAQALYILKRYFFRPASKTDEPPKRDTLVQIYAGHGLWTPDDKIRSSPEFLEHYDAVTAITQSWFVAANKLWARVQKAGGRDYYRMAGLRVVALSSQVIHSGLVMLQSGFDKYLPWFREIVSLTKAILKFWEEKKAVPHEGELDTGILVALVVVGWKCRHRGTRKEVIEMLRSTNRREGIYDSHMMAAAVDFIRKTEERGSTTGVIPEENRVAVTGAWIDTQKRLLKTAWEACEYLPAKVEKEGTVSW